MLKFFFASAFINPRGTLSSKRVVGIPAGIIFILLHLCLVILNLFFGFAVDDFVLNGNDNLGYLCTGLLGATIADSDSKPKGEGEPSGLTKLVATANFTISSKKLVGVIAGFTFCAIQILLTFANVFYQKKLAENIFDHLFGLMILAMVLLGIDIARPSIQKLQALFKK